LETEVLSGHGFFNAIPAYGYSTAGAELFGVYFWMIFAFHQIASAQEWSELQMQLYIQQSK
jgi:hypothetical protein